MKRNQLTMLACPTCGGTLTLRAFEGHEEVETGVLLCSACRTWFPIEAHVPVLLVFATPLHGAFAARHAAPLAALGDYLPPRGVPERGEESVQKTFTEEWHGVRDDTELSFTYSVDDLRKLNQQVWMKWLPGASPGIRRVLNVGIGLGRETQVLSGLVPDADVVAVDLNLAVLAKGRELAREPRIHAVVASLFHLPFRDRSFDLVYSQGVLHHTRSTAAAFRSIAAKVRPHGYLFVWVYGLDDHLLRKGMPGAATRVAKIGEDLVRPVVSRLPGPLRNAFFKVVAVAVHPLILTRVRHRRSWRLANSEHGLRDWLSPRYAHRHSYNEVLEWFAESNFEIVAVQSPHAYRQLFGKSLWGVGATGRRVGD